MARLNAMWMQLHVSITVRPQIPLLVDVGSSQSLWMIKLGSRNPGWNNNEGLWMGNFVISRMLKKKYVM